MTLAKIKLDEGVKLNFGVSITGTSGVAETRFVIENKNFSVSFPCTTINEGVQASIEGLEKIFAAGTYDAHLEVVVENKIYRPLSDKIEFEPSVMVTGNSASYSPLKEEIKVESVVVNVINETMLRRVQAATMIAKSLHYVPESTESPTEIIEHAIDSVKEMSTEQIGTLKEMLKLAESVGIEFSK